MKSRIVLLVPLATVLLPSFSLAQTTAAKDPRAVSLLSAAVSALANGMNISDVTLTGTVTRTAGSDVETGAVTLQALGGADSRTAMTLSNGPRVQVINQSQGAPAGEWSGPDGTPHRMAQHNSLVPAAWFFPALALAEALNDPAVQLHYAGQEMRDGVAVQHVRFWRIIPSGILSAAAVTMFEHVTAADVYLAAANSLPVALDFNMHPDNNEKLDIPVEIRYGDYRKINGILLPAHILKLINNSLFLDLNITDAAVNTNLSPADFATIAASQ